MEHQTPGMPDGRTQTEPKQMQKKGMERHGKTPGRKQMEVSCMLSHPWTLPNRSESPYRDRECFSPWHDTHVGKVLGLGWTGRSTNASLRTGMCHRTS